MQVFNHLKEYRVRLGLSQEDFGKRVQVSRQTISMIERGKEIPSIELAMRLARVCGCSVKDIFKETEEIV